MPLEPKPRRPHHPVIRGVIEVTSILFLFYSNLLMAEFNRSSRHKTLTAALHDIVTPENFIIAVLCSLVGYVVFEYLRHKS